MKTITRRFQIELVTKEADKDIINADEINETILEKLDGNFGSWGQFLLEVTEIKENKGNVKKVRGEHD